MAANLPMFNVGLPPAPRMGVEEPYFFNIPNGMNNNGEPAYNKHHVAEYFSGLVFHLSDDGDIIGYPAEPAGRWREAARPMANNGGPMPNDEAAQIIHGGRSSRKTNRRNYKMQGGVNAQRPTFYVGLSRSPRAGTPAPYWTPIYGSSTGEDTSRMFCDVFERKAYRFSDNGHVIGYPDQPVGECVDGFPPAVEPALAPAPVGGRRKASRRRNVRRRRSTRRGRNQRR